MSLNLKISFIADFISAKTYIRHVLVRARRAFHVGLLPRDLQRSVL